MHIALFSSQTERELGAVKKDNENADWIYQDNQRICGQMDLRSCCIHHRRLKKNCKANTDRRGYAESATNAQTNSPFLQFLNGLFLSSDRRTSTTPNDPQANCVYPLSNVPLLADEWHEIDITIFQAAQMGKVAIVAKLIETDPAIVKSRDFQDVTALHWAAINNQIPVAKYLMDHGAEVDAIGGELVATPLHWCTRYEPGLSKVEQEKTEFGYHG